MHVRIVKWAVDYHIVVSIVAKEGGRTEKKKEYLMLAECLSVRGRLSSMRAGVRWPQMKSVIGFRFDSIEHLIRIVVMVLLY